jgi:hypothetical protein
MASYIKASLERSYAESFLAELERNENQYFFFVGKGTTWANENSPSAYTDTVASEYQVMNDIIGYKKLNPANIIFALPRYAWTSGTVYDQYDDAVELFDEDDPSIFYVVTDENNIYKCLGNNNGGESTEKPAQVLSTPFTTSDGYRWQYLSTIRESDLPYELVDYIPVDFATLSSDTETVNQYNAQTEAVNGSITRMVVSNSSGASAGVYPNTVSEETIVTELVNFFNSSFVLNVSSYTETGGVKKVRITDSTSISRLTNVASGSDYGINGYVGYVMKVNRSSVNPSQINNYGIITAVTSGADFYEFTIEDDVVDFTITTPAVATDFVSVEILPHIRITGNGNGVYAFSVMNSSKNIVSANVVNGGRNYSKTSVEVVSQKTTNTNHPTIRSVLSPKGGHGSNILKELNVKDILVIVEVTEQDADTIISGGSYRQFGIIKNPLLNDGTFTVAGAESLYYRDITLIPENGIVDSSIFDSTDVNLIVGEESYSAAKVFSVKATSATTITLKTLNASGQFITKQDRNNDYVLTLTTAPTQNFILGEIVTQTVPAGTLLSSGVQYGYDLVAKGRVLSVNSSGTQIVVRLTTDGNFVSGVAVEGEQSLVTATVSTVAPRYGEYVWVTNRGINGTPQFVVNGLNYTLYKVVDVGQAYFDLDNTPSYRGLHVLELSTSISAATAGVDTTSSTLTPNSYSNGDVVHQGVTGQFGHYATGVVYNWEFVNDSYGKLYLTDVVGSFKSVETDGLTGTQLGAYIVAAVQEPEIDRSSGEVLYINNVRPIQRIYAQEEEFRLRLGF